MTNDDYISAVKTLSENIGDLERFASSSRGKELEVAFLKTICWCQGLSQVYKSNPAKIHLAGAWSEIVNILALVPLCFYRPSIISLRVVLDEILAWSFYESHPVEFRTSLKDTSYFVRKSEVHDFHKTHSWQEDIALEKLGIWSNMNGLYSELSRYIHAQTIETMSLAESFADIVVDDEKVAVVISLARKTDETIAKFLGSLYQDAFTQFQPELQAEIITGWDKNVIGGLGLTL